MRLETGGRGGPGGLVRARLGTGPKAPSFIMGAVHPPCNRTVPFEFLRGLIGSFSRGFGGFGGRLPK
jgi:hypothetical protein